MSSLFDMLGQAVWTVGIVTWFVIRYPYRRRARRSKIVSDRRTPLDRMGLGAALLGQAIIPALYVATGFPAWAERSQNVWIVLLGAIIFGAALWLFRRSHKELGRNWSVTLQIREKHKLVTTGPYALIRHPMYTAFLLMAIGQAFLLPNWVAGFVGLAGFVVLFFARLEKEERMMLDIFGSEYAAYMEKTTRLIPHLY